MLGRPHWNDLGDFEVKQPTTHELYSLSGKAWKVTVDFQYGDDDVGISEGWMFDVEGCDNAGNDELYWDADEALDAAQDYINENCD